MLGIPVNEELVAVLSAFALAPVVAVAHIALFRWRKGASAEYALLPFAFVIYELAWTVGAILASRGFPVITTWIAGSATVGFVCLVYMQVFSQISRGFSLRILVDIRDHGSLDLAGILREYSEGRGVDWLMEKRFSGLEHMGLMARTEGRLEATRPWGMRLGRMGVWAKRVLKLGGAG